MLTDPSGRILLACMWMVTESVRLNTSLSPAPPLFLLPTPALELKHILQIQRSYRLLQRSNIND